MCARCALRKSSATRGASGNPVSAYLQGNNPFYTAVYLPGNLHLHRYRIADFNVHLL